MLVAQVLPAILFVKANNAEPCEIARFKRLAHVDLTKHLKKRKMKALIPQIIQSIYVAALFVFCAGSLLLSKGSFDGCRMVSFLTSLVLVIEPIQVRYQEQATHMLLSFLIAAAHTVFMFTYSMLLFTSSLTSYL